MHKKKKEINQPHTPVFKYSSAAKTASLPIEILSAPDLKYSDATSKLE